MNEEWRDVVGYEGLYEVSSLGRVRVSPSCGAPRYRPGHIRALRKSRNGYVIVDLSKDGAVHTLLVHSLVASAFIGVRPDGLVVNHKDGTRDNNEPSNLEYTTYSENIIHAFQFGRRPGKKKLSADAVKVILRLYCYGQMNQREIADAFGLCQPTVGEIVRGEIWGYVGQEIRQHRSRIHVQKRGQKLNIEVVRQIKDRMASGSTNAKLASDFGLSKVMIGKIRNGVCWAHVA